MEMCVSYLGESIDCCLINVIIYPTWLYSTASYLEDLVAITFSKTILYNGFDTILPYSTLLSFTKTFRADPVGHLV